MDQPSRGGALAALEQALLGVARHPPQREFDRHRWRPESPDRACPRCGGSRPEDAGARHGCPRCDPGGRQPALGDRVVRLGPYEPPLSDWLLAIKHGRWHEMARRLGFELGSEIGNRMIPVASRPIVVPMPTPFWRAVNRGIDHAGAIAAGCAAALDAPVLPLLARRGGLTQQGRSAAARRSGPLGLRLRRRGAWSKVAAACPSAVGWSRRRAPADDLRGRRLVLVDDVRTTGATLLRATSLLRRLHPAEIVVAVVAAAD